MSWALRLVLPVCLVVAAAVAAGGLWRVLGRTGTTAASDASATLSLGSAAGAAPTRYPPAPTPSAGRAAGGEGTIRAVPAPVRVTAPVEVVNASDVTGLAGRTAGALRARGVTVAVVGNLRAATRPQVGTVYYPPGTQPQASALARLAGVPAVAPAPAWLAGHGRLVLVVTRPAGPS